MLADLEFSDLMLIPGGDALLKGVPGHDRKLLPVPEDCREEVEHIRGLLGQKDLLTLETFRFKHERHNYRVSSTQEIEFGRVLFLRRLPDSVPSIHDLGMNENVVKWLLSSRNRKGLVIFSGPQASGKTTSASAFVQERLRTLGGHAVTYERPVEMPLSGRHGEFGYCLQNEFHHEADIGPAVEQSHRLGAPDITYVGEIKGKHTSSETLGVALGSSEQLVVTTIHGFDVMSALDRFLGFSQEVDGSMASTNLAHTLLAILHLELISDGDKKCLRMPEFLLCPFDESSKGIRAKIKERQLGQLHNDMREQQNQLLMPMARVN